MTNEDKKTYLQKAYYLDKQIKYDTEELESLKALKVSLKGIDYSKDRVQESGSACASYTKVVEKIVSMELKILEDISSLLDIKSKIDMNISRLDNQNERIICKYRHLQFKKWEDIADMMYMSERHVKRIYKSALAHISIKDVTKCH